MISYSGTWGNLGLKLPPHAFVKQEVEMLIKAEELGFDAVWSPEHHFDANYCACPDPFIPLSYTAARTERIQLGTAAIILPWNNPVRVVEKLAMLDHLSDGRLMVGFGRGLATMEYDGFGMDMGTSRERFDESLAMVLNGIRNGYVEGDGPYYPQSRVDIQPAASPALADRLHIVALTPDSALHAADLGATLMTFVTASDEEMKPLLDGYRERFAQRHGRKPPPEILVDYAYVSEDGEKAAEAGRKYAGRFYESLVLHYKFDDTHFAETKGYETYDETAKMVRDDGMDAAADAYVAPQAGIGSPEEVIEKFRHRREILGETGLLGCFLYGGMTLEEADRSLRLFASEVMPELRRLEAEPLRTT